MYPFFQVPADASYFLLNFSSYQDRFLTVSLMNILFTISRFTICSELRNHTDRLPHFLSPSLWTIFEPCTDFNYCLRYIVSELFTGVFPSLDFEHLGGNVRVLFVFSYLQQPAWMLNKYFLN